jgi:ATP-dependent DNA helicase RecG
MADLSLVPVTKIRGIGPKKAEALELIGIKSVADLLEYFPFRYEDYRLKALHEVTDGEKVTLEGVVAGIPVLQRYGRNKSRLACKVRCGSFLITAVWFNRHFLKDRLTLGTTVIMTGKWDARRKQLTVSESEFQNSRRKKAGTVQPVYSVAGSITQNVLRDCIGQALDEYADRIEEWIPESILEKRNLMSRPEAIRLVHRPGGIEEGQRARMRIVYEEFFLFQLKIQAHRMLVRSRRDGIAREIDRSKVRAFVRSLPFELTDSQKRVVLEILHDMSRPIAMNRLLQGDVGSGKTVVAAIALYANMLSGYQGAMMVPTEILAEQHFEVLKRWLEPFGVQIDLLTGRLSARERKDALAALQMGLTDIVVGTHALIQDDVFFRSLGLVVTDEQHRFGVQQRSILRKKGLQPDVLMMTATPIPRTLAITAFGDMDVSTLRERPKGRLPVKTYWVRPNRMDRVFSFLQKELANGRQAYVICPLIEESEKLDAQNAVELHHRLQQALPEWKVELLHGKMSGEEKDGVMRRFHDGESSILVATTVVEVGVHVANATVMVIYDADRFGLSQLHQLRGRVGRGRHQSYCILIADPKTEMGVERMQVMVETDDGFEIARRDLELRGPGEFFGTKQSGLPEFRVADILNDFKVLEMAREDVAELLNQPDFWTGKPYLKLRDILRREGILDGEALD